MARKHSLNVRRQLKFWDCGLGDRIAKTLLLLGGPQEMTMDLVVDFGRLSWPRVVLLDISANRVGRFVPALHEGDRRAL